MNAEIATAFAGLAGAVIGGLTSFGTTWITQTSQSRERNLAVARKQREDLYVEFTKESSRLFADALSRERADIQDCVKLYTIVAHMRMVSPIEVVNAADRIVVAIIETYNKPNLTLKEMSEFAARGGLDPFHEFGGLCRAELAHYRSEVEPGKISQAQLPWPSAPGGQEKLAA